MASTERPLELSALGGLTEEPESAAGPRYLVVRADAFLVAIPLDEAREIIPARSLTRLPGAQPWIAGLLNLRGRVLTVVDLNRRLGADAGAGPIVVVEVGSRALGLRVTAVDAVRGAADTERPVDAAQSAGGLFRGTVALPGGALPVLDLPVLQRAALADA